MGSYEALSNKAAQRTNTNRTGEAHQPLSSPPCLSPSPTPVKSKIIAKEIEKKERRKRKPVPYSDGWQIARGGEL